MKFPKEDTCSCLLQLHKQCEQQSSNPPPDSAQAQQLLNDVAFGKMAYTASILLMFSFVIVLLMFRSIKRSSAAIEMDALLDAMRYREEMDSNARQKRRLMKAKTKVTAWLSRTHEEGKEWRSSPQLMQPRKYTSSTVSEIPAIVVTDDCTILPRRAHTPCLSLIYDFGGSHEHRDSIESEYDSRRVDRHSISSEVSLSTSRQSMSLDRDCIPRLSLQSQSMSID